MMTRTNQRPRAFRLEYVYLCTLFIINQFYLLLRDPRVGEQDKPDVYEGLVQLHGQLLQLLLGHSRLSQAVGAEVHHRDAHLQPNVLKLRAEFTAFDETCCQTVSSCVT